MYIIIKRQVIFYLKSDKLKIYFIAVVHKDLN